MVAVRHADLLAGRAGRPDAVHVGVRGAGHGDAGGAVPGDIGKQAEVTYGSIVHLLDYAGLGPADLVTTIEFCVESALRDYRAVAPVRERLLSPPWPASTGAICKGLLRPEFLLEVFPTALYPEGAPTTKAQKAGSGNTGSQTAGDAS